MQFGTLIQIRSFHRILYIEGMIPYKTMYIEKFGTLIQIRSFHRIIYIEGYDFKQNNVCKYVDEFRTLIEIRLCHRIL